MKSQRMFIAIVDRNDASSVMAELRRSGSRGGTIAGGKGTATNSILAALGLGESRKEILYSMLDSDIVDSAFDYVKRVKTKGIALLIESLDGEDKMEKSEFVLIQVISEYGYSDDIMAAARKVGASGGTIVMGRGTATEEDTKFFGYPIVQEKEILFIVSKRDSFEKIVEAINSIEAIKKRGKAIIFTLPVERFVNLS